MNTSDDLYLINGNPADVIPVTDRGLHYGDGLFETIRVHKGKPRYWTQHIQRLIEGCRQLHIPEPDAGILQAESSRLIETTRPDNAVLKIIITRGSGKRAYRPPDPAVPMRIVALYPYIPAAHVNLIEGVRLRVCETRLACNPALAGIKHLNRLEHILAHCEWVDEGIVDGIMLDQQGLVIEGTMSNIFFCKNGELFTPDLSRCGVQGIMRGEIIKLAKELHFSLDIGHFRLAELLSADEVFITNSIYGIWPVREIDDKQFPVGPLTELLLAKVSGN